VLGRELGGDQARLEAELEAFEAEAAAEGIAAGMSAPRRGRSRRDGGAAPPEQRPAWMFRSVLARG